MQCQLQGMNWHSQALDFLFERSLEVPNVTAKILEVAKYSNDLQQLQG